MNDFARATLTRVASLIGALFAAWIVGLANYWLIRIWVDPWIGFWVFPLIAVDIYTFMVAYDFISNKIVRHGTNQAHGETSEKGKKSIVDRNE
jgi:hypothetical protein